MDSGPVINRGDTTWWTGAGHSSSTFPGWALAEALHRATAGRTPSYVLVTVRPDIDLEQVRRAAAGPGRMFPVEVTPMPVDIDSPNWPTVTVTAVGGIEPDRVAVRVPVLSGSGAPGA